eukprot:gnl/TRDRNA2_/TRDRNA2_188074_c0_seq1.p1 gnl/TRDRNA2_/TRDRNA2_188074_c0~~gnl/TRDRNA2_/TRDRNA2_188074_c0_seq1.p1  ORF type:complete len:215 (+),score=34.62 gnl/TRDRNA2_/TRDRNA2_188074_c0_seq1:129-773(+)
MPLPLLDVYASNESSDQTIKRARVWFTVLLVLQACGTGWRYLLGDVHGGLYMLTVVFVGLLMLTFDEKLDIPYCKFYGVLSFMGGLMDLANGVQPIAMTGGENYERLIRSRHAKMTDEIALSLALMALPLVHLICSMLQLTSAFLCYLVCKDIDEEEADSQSYGPLLATQEEARIYGAALQHSMRRPGGRSEQPKSPKMPGVQPFKGTSHKLPM